MSDDWPFCECGVTLLDGEDELCSTCAGAPHHHNCPCDECEIYWANIADESKRAADRANRALVCSCGWTGAFIEHHNSEAYGAVAQVGCVMTFRDPERSGSLPKRWTGTEWAELLSGGIVQDGFTMGAWCHRCRRQIPGAPYARGEMLFCRPCAEEYGLVPVDMEGE